MSDRHAGYIVVLDKDLKDEDSRLVIAALKQIRGVCSVKPVVADIKMVIAQQRESTRLADQLFKVLYGPEPAP